MALTKSFLRMFSLWILCLQLMVLLHSPGIMSDVRWPDDTYGLPMPQEGCPNTPEVTWQTGWVLQDMVRESGYPHSNPFHLKSDLSDDIKRFFCMKTTTSTKGNILWPRGKYCIYRKGGNCPAHMKHGYYRWDDEGILSLDNQNEQEGVYPDGVYDTNTRIYFCCRTDGDTNVPINLPTSKPFFLLAQGSKQCQQVKWALATAEWLEYDTEGDDKRGSVYPYNGKIGDPTIYYCYYQSCNYSLTGETGNLSSPMYPGPVPRGQFCSWSITVAPGYHVSLKFDVFSPSGNETEHLQVFDGGNETAQILHLISGNSPPPAFGVNSTSNQMFIVFRSTSKPVTSINSGYFYARYTTKEPSPTVATTKTATTITRFSLGTNSLQTASHTDTTTNEPTKQQFPSSSIPEHVTSQATEPASANSSARDGAKRHTRNETLLVAILLPLVIILIVVLLLIFLWKKRRNRKSSHDVKVIYDGNVNEGKVSVANPIYSTETIGSHNLNPIYDASTDDDASKMRDPALKESENPLYDRTETAPDDTDQHLGCANTYETAQETFYSSADNYASDLQPELEKRLFQHEGNLNKDDASDNPLYDEAEPSTMVNPIYQM